MKPDFLDLDNDGNKTEAMKAAGKKAKSKPARMKMKMSDKAPKTNIRKTYSDY